MAGNRGRTYESDATQVARLVESELHRKDKLRKVSYSNKQGFFSGGAGDPATNNPGTPLPPPATVEPTYAVTIAAGTSGAVTFPVKATFGGCHLFFDFERGLLNGGGCIYLKHDGTTVQRLHLKGVTGDLPGLDAAGTPDQGLSASVAGDDLVLTIDAAASPVDDLVMHIKPVYREVI